MGKMVFDPNKEKLKKLFIFILRLNKQAEEQILFQIQPWKMFNVLLILG